MCARWRGLLLNSAITAWVLTSIICGFSSGSYYKRCGGRQWKLAFGLALGAPPVVIGCLMFVLNTVAVMYSSSAALPFLTVLGVIAIWVRTCMYTFASTDRALAVAGLMCALDSCWHSDWSQRHQGRRLPMSCVEHATTDSSGSLVLKRLVPGSPWRHPSVRLHFHRDAFHLDCDLELQILL